MERQEKHSLRLTTQKDLLAEMKNILAEIESIIN